MASVCSARSLGHSEEVERNMMRTIEVMGGAAERMDLPDRRFVPMGMLKLGTLLRRGGFDTVHVHTPIALAYLLRPMRGVSVFYTHHNSSFSRIGRFVRVVDRVVSGYIAIGREIAAAMTPFVCKPIAVIPNGVASSFEVTRRESRTDGLRFLAVGNLKAEKDYGTMVEAFARASAEWGTPAPPTLTIVGTGEERSSIERRIADFALGDRVSLVGARSDVPTIMADHDVMLSSSSTEGLPMALLEAASSGLPIVATDVGDVRTIVVDGVNGRLVKSRDPTALADAMIDCGRSPGRLTSMGERSRERSRFFSIQTTAAAYLEFFRKEKKAHRPVLFRNGVDE